jgi:hypothetical protein
MAVAALLAGVILGLRVGAADSGADDTLALHIESQQPLTLDLRAGSARSPYVFGMNVFPADGTRAPDGAYGFMPYDAQTVGGLRDAGVTMLRFPGGTWGEQHTPSYEQINAFLRLTQQTHATPLMQVRLAGSTPAQAAALVRYCNKRQNPLRRQYPTAPFVPVHYWAIGNEPDLRGPGYTAADYVRDFIAFAVAMKAVDPTIQIFGPEISQYNGPDAPPLDADGVPWLAGFLRGIAAYQHAHKWQILDGVSIHCYPFETGVDSSNLLFASANEWRYALPPLGDAVRQIMGTDLPIAITEINTSPLDDTMASPLAAALWWADTLGTLLEQRVGYVDFFAARGVEQPDMLLSGSGGATPLYRVMQLYTHMASTVLPVGGTPGPVSVYAAINTADNTLTLMLVNKSSTEAAITVDPLQSFSTWHHTRLTVPPYAIACAVLHRNGRGRAFLYAPTPEMVAAGQPGVIRIESLE